jgi:hypothetical protein
VTTIIDRQSIEATYKTIKPYIRVTPVVGVDGGDNSGANTTAVDFADAEPGRERG